MTIAPVPGTIKPQTITDSLGRVVTIAYDLVPGGTETYDRITFKNGREIKVYQKKVRDALRPDLATTAAPFPNLFGTLLGPGIDTLAVTRVSLPNLKEFQVFYNIYNEVARVVLPTGGAIDYHHDAGYSNAGQSIPKRAPFTGQATPSFTDGQVGASIQGCSYSAVTAGTDPAWRPYIYRRLLSRRVFLDGPPPAPTSPAYHLTTYSRPELTSTAEPDVAGIFSCFGRTGVSTVSQSGFVEVQQSGPGISQIITNQHYFYTTADATNRLNAGPGSQIGHAVSYGPPDVVPKLLLGKEYRTETVGFRRVERIFETKSTGPVVPYQEDTLLLDAAGATKPRSSRYFQHDNNANQTRVMEAAFDRGFAITGQGTSVDPLFDTPAPLQTQPPNALRRTDWTYGPDTKYLNNPVYYLNLLGLVDTETVYNASNTIVGQTTYGYDEYPANRPFLDRGALFGYGYGGTFQDGSFQDRGNQTSVSRLVKRLSGTGSGTKANIVTYREYDSLGNVHRVTDGRQKQTSFVFDTASYAFTKQINRPTIGGVTLTTKYDYDTELGLPTLIEEPNGMKTAVDYLDPLMRVTRIRRGPAPTTSPRSSTTFAYTDDPGNLTVKSTSDQFEANDSRLKSETQYDKLGREIRLCQGNYCAAGGATPTVVDKTYDGLNRVQTVSNPGAGAPGPVTSTVYDSLNRPLSVCYPTADCEVTTHAGSVTTATDPAGKKRELTGDSLGRLVQVIEAPGALGFTTSYGYDGLDNLTGVFQISSGRTFNYDSLKRLLDATNPESGKIDYDYDENGNLLSVTQERKIPNSTTVRLATTNVYDDLNRPMTRSYNDSTPAVIYCYDGKTYNSGACTTTAATFSYGQMTGVGNTNGSTNYTHNDQGRIQTSTPKVDIDRPFAYFYYADGSLAMSTIPGPKNRVTCYDLQGRPIWVSGQLTLGDCINGTAATAANSYGWVSSFAPHGAVQELNFGATSTYKERWCYNARLQVSGLRLGAASTANCVYQGGDIFGLRLEYTASNQTANNGNLMQQFIQMRKSAADASEIRLRQDYGYDSINRITSANEFVEAGTGTGWQRGWNYDSVGNLAATSGDALPAGTPALLTQYEQTTNRLKYFRSTLQAADVMNYDDSGNLTDRSANIGSSRTTYEYDAENRLRKVDGGGTQENFYDGQGRRVRRVAGSTTVTFIYNANGELVLEYGSPVSTPGVQFLTVDHLGSTRVATRPDGSVVSRMDYEPFGVEAATTSRVARRRWLHRRFYVTAAFYRQGTGCGDGVGLLRS